MMKVTNDAFLFPTINRSTYRIRRAEMSALVLRHFSIGNVVIRWIFYACKHSNFLIMQMGQLQTQNNVFLPSDPFYLRIKAFCARV